MSHDTDADRAARMQSVDQPVQQGDPPDLPKPGAVTDEHTAVFDKLGSVRLRLMLDTGMLVSHLVQPAHEWLAAHGDTEAAKPQPETEA